METWRIIATGAFVVGGLLMVLVAMAQVRDRKHSQRVQVWQAGLIGVAVVAVLTVGIAFWLPSVVAWALVAATVAAVLFVTLVD
jgi:peptidoglycan/LPS O-acetylase OafA/YrhL